LLRWRNRPETRRVMFTDHEITADEHRAWWRAVAADASRKVLLYEDEAGPAGVVNYFDIDAAAGTCHWGFYLGDRVAGPGVLQTWAGLERAAIDHAFGTLGCRSLRCETFAFNEAVLDMHRRFGFEETGRTTRMKDGNPSEVVLMELRRPAADDAECVALLGSANWEIFADDLATELAGKLGKPYRALVPPFGQYRMLLADPGSTLRREDPKICVFCERFEDLLESPFAIFDASQQEGVAARLEEYIATLRDARASLRGTFLVFDLVPVRPVSRTLQDSDHDGSSATDAFLGCLNRRLAQACAELPDCHLLPLAEAARNYGRRRANPAKYWHLGRLPYSSGFFSEMARMTAGALMALAGRTARVVVLDLDNTLWGGVIGDDGLDGIRIGGDYPGSAFAEVQNAVLALRDRGIVLTICSKNNEEIALEAFRRHPGMRVKESDFVARRINWQDKADNIRALAEEIGVGLGALCLIDDSPYERAAVRNALPDVAVPDLPADIADWPAFLLELPAFASFRLTQEDRERQSRYAARATIRREQAQYGSREDYWRGLAMQLFFTPLRDTNRQRVLQLLAKTNQFNMTTRRHTDVDLAGIAARGGVTLAVGLADRFSGRETVGVLVLVPDGQRRDVLAIDSFVLSCRVLGRSVETGILGWLCRYAIRQGFTKLEGEFVATPRNDPARSVYPDHGFAAVGNGVYELPLGERAVPCPDWFTITEEIENIPL
ncbi:MAG: HAD-IIIC family phosphatase, partial [Ignavibacteria bacterium]